MSFQRARQNQTSADIGGKSKSDAKKGPGQVLNNSDPPFAAACGPIKAPRAKMQRTRHPVAAPRSLSQFFIQQTWNATSSIFRFKLPFFAILWLKEWNWNHEKSMGD